MPYRVAICNLGLNGGFDVSRLTKILENMFRQPRYTMMRGLARFGIVRAFVANGRSLIHKRRIKNYIRECEQQIGSSLFKDVDQFEFVKKLHDDGVAFGINLPASQLEEILAWAAEQPCYADRDAALGFQIRDRSAAETKLGKPILVAQYFNTLRECKAINRIVNDPVIRWIAASYLGSLPTFVGANLWWTFPVAASEVDRSKHAHVYHRDVDDFRFFNFFFYLTDVVPGEGAHMCVIASYKNPPQLKTGDRWNIRRYTDQEITSTYLPYRIKEICGGAGTGFAENTLCIHKGSTPRAEARLLLQLQFALFDYGVTDDFRKADKLELLV